jgi:hypothetical protein
MKRERQTATEGFGFFQEAGRKGWKDRRQAEASHPDTTAALRNRKTGGGGAVEGTEEAAFFRVSVYACPPVTVRFSRYLVTHSRLDRVLPSNKIL